MDYKKLDAGNESGGSPHYKTEQSLPHNGDIFAPMKDVMAPKEGMPLNKNQVDVIGTNG
jgi:hypothetical protein